MLERLKLTNQQRRRMLLLDERSNRREYIIIPHRAPAPTTRLESRGPFKRLLFLQRLPGEENKEREGTNKEISYKAICP